MQLWFIVSLILSIIVAIFAVMNANPVPIKLIFSEVQLSQALVIFISATLGAIIVSLLGLVKQIKLSIKNKDLLKQVKQLSDENQVLQAQIHQFEVMSLEAIEPLTTNTQQEASEYVNKASSEQEL